MDGAQERLLQAGELNDGSQNAANAAVVTGQGQAAAAAGVDANAGAPADAAAVHVNDVNVVPAAGFGWNSPGVKLFLVAAALVAGGGVVSSIGLASACALHAMSADSSIQSMPGIGSCHAAPTTAPVSPSSTSSASMTRTASQWATLSHWLTMTASQWSTPSGTTSESASSSPSPSNTASSSQTSSQVPSLITRTPSQTSSATTSSTGTPSGTATASPGFGMQYKCDLPKTLNCQSVISALCSWMGSLGGVNTSVAMNISSNPAFSAFKDSEFCDAKGCVFPATNDDVIAQEHIASAQICGFVASSPIVVRGYSVFGAPVYTESTVPWPAEGDAQYGHLPFAEQAVHGALRGDVADAVVDGDEPPLLEAPAA